LNCCSKTSYVYDLGIYPGSDHENQEAKATKKDTKKVTKKLVKKGKKKPHPNDGIIEEEQAEMDPDKSENIEGNHTSNEEILASERIVLKLLENIHKKGHIDNYFKSIPLCKKLQEKGIEISGTVQRSRKGLPTEIAKKLQSFLEESFSKSSGNFPEKTPGKGQLKCRYFHQGTTTYQCNSCKIPLHLPCFRPFHTSV